MLCVNADSPQWQFKELKHGGPTAYVVVDGVSRVVGMLCLGCMKVLERDGESVVLAQTWNRFGYDGGPYRPMSVRCIECGRVHDWASNIAGMEALKVWAPYDVCPECKRLQLQSVRQEEMMEHLLDRVAEKMTTTLRRDAVVYARDLEELRMKLGELTRKIETRENGTMSTTTAEDINGGKTGSFADRAMGVGMSIGLDRMGLRSGATLAVNLARKPLLAALRARMGKGREVGQIIRTAEAMMQTDLGDGAMRLVLSGAVRVVPGIPDAVRGALADEFLVSGGSKFIDVVVDIFAGPVIAAISGGVAVLADPEVTARMADGAKVAGQAIGVRAEGDTTRVGG